MKNILITGGAGFIGSKLALRLIDAGYQVTVLDNLLPQIHGENPETTSPLYQSIKDKVHFIKGDVTRKEDWKNALQNQHVIVHFAAETGTGQSMYEIERYTQVNVSGTAILLDYLTNEKHKIEKVIIASSRAVYGEGKYFSQQQQQFIYPSNRLEQDLENGIFELRNPNNPTEFLQVVATDEDSKIQPKSIYGLTKYHQEQALMICCSSLNIPCVALRYQNVYGPGQSLTNPYTGILSIFSTRILQQKSINIFEDGLESRDFVFIDDVVQATFLSIEKNTANYNVMNVGTGIATSVLQVANTLMQHYEKAFSARNSGQYRKVISDIILQTSVGFNN
ncbi:MAG: SDR family NAD(P)-dependent oxidoreductase [Chitinophagales bacterium]